MWTTLQHSTVTTTNIPKRKTIPTLDVACSAPRLATKKGSTDQKGVEVKSFPRLWTFAHLTGTLLPAIGYLLVTTYTAHITGCLLPTIYYLLFTTYLLLVVSLLTTYYLLLATY